MKFAVLDNDGNVLTAWDDARLAYEMFVKACEGRTTVSVVGRRPFRRVKKKVTYPELLEAVTYGLERMVLAASRASSREEGDF